MGIYGVNIGFGSNCRIAFYRSREVNMMDKNELCQKIEQIYPKIGKCGIDVNVSYDDNNDRWKVHLKKDNKSLDTFLEPGDAELCMEDKQCVSLGIELSQLKENIGT